MHGLPSKRLRRGRQAIARDEDASISHQVKENFPNSAHRRKQNRGKQNSVTGRTIRNDNVKNAAGVCQPLYNSPCQAIRYSMIVQRKVNPGLQPRPLYRGRPSYTVAAGCARSYPSSASETASPSHYCGESHRRDDHAHIKGARAQSPQQRPANSNRA